MSADPVLEEFPLEAMEEIDVVAKEWIQEQSDKEVVNKYTCVVQSKKKKELTCRNIRNVSEMLAQAFYHLR